MNIETLLRELARAYCKRNAIANKDGWDYNDSFKYREAQAEVLKLETECAERNIVPPWHDIWEMQKAAQFGVAQTTPLCILTNPIKSAARARPVRAEFDLHLAL